MAKDIFLKELYQFFLSRPKIAAEYDFGNFFFQKMSILKRRNITVLEANANKDILKSANGAIKKSKTSE